MKKEIFDSLAKLSPELMPGKIIPKQPPAVEISGELAFCLDTLMITVGQHLKLSPQSVFEKILTTGIESWVTQLPEKTKKDIGLNGTAKNASIAEDDWDDDDPDPARAQQAAYAQMTESYGYTPLTAHSVNSKSGSSNGRGDQRNNGGSRGRNSKQKKVRTAAKKHPPKKQNSRRRKYAPNKVQASAQ